MPRDHQKRQYLLSKLWQMAIGDAFAIDRVTFGDCFAYNPLTGRPAIDELLEALPGSNWGCYTAKQMPDGTVIVMRHNEGKKHVREDWDRRDSVYPSNRKF